MTDVLLITVPIYLTILVGYLAVRTGRLAEGSVHALGAFAVNFALPAMVFTAVAGQELKETLSWTYMLAYLAGSLAVGSLALAVARGPGRNSTSGAACLAMGCASSNSAFIGFPVLLLAAPKVASVALALNTVVENLAVIPLFLFLAEGGSSVDAPVGPAVRRAFSRLLMRPLIMGLIAGVLVSTLGLDLPEPVSRTINLFAQASSALTLFFVGGTLAGVRLRRLLAIVAPMALAKLVLHPLCVWLAIIVAGVIGLGALDTQLGNAAIMMAAMPVMAMYPVLVQRYGGEGIAAAMLLFTTVGSFVTVNALLWILMRQPG